MASKSFLNINMVYISSTIYNKIKVYNTYFGIIDIFKAGKILIKDLNKKGELIYQIKY